MSPHLEQIVGYIHDLGISTTGGVWEPVPNTQHFTGDIVTNNAILSHQLAESDPEKYREVSDFAGDVCKGHGQFELLDKKFPRA